ncbi:MAG: hypothetical protein ABW034_06220 [Steroidobacteraceae bacterium]
MNMRITSARWHSVRDSRSVNSEPFIGMGSLGCCIRHGGFVLSVTATVFTG